MQNVAGKHRPQLVVNMQGIQVCTSTCHKSVCVCCPTASTVTGHSVAKSMDFGHHTHTHRTHDQNTAGKPVPMLFPNSHICWCHLEYLVKWKGYDSRHNSWTAHYNIHMLDVVAAFYHLNPRAPHQVNTATFNSISFSRVDTATSWRSSVSEHLDWMNNETSVYD